MAASVPTLKFAPGDLHRAFAIAKLVKPQTGDYVLKVQGRTLSIVSYDARKYARAEIKADEVKSLPDDFVSDEFFLSDDRKTLLDTDLQQMEIKVTDKGMNLVARDADKTKERKAVIRRRPDNSRRPRLPKRLEVDRDLAMTVKASVLEDLLRHVSCSALVKETKTEDDMRVNQVHFYKDHECVYANARSHATVVRYPGLNLDCSIVSSDIPLIKQFCAKLGDEEVLFGQDKTHVYVQDPRTGSCVFASRVNAKRPEFSPVGFEEELFSTVISIYGDELNTSVGWAVTAVEGTSRITFATAPPTREDKGNADLVLSADGEVVSKFPVTVEKGALRADFHIGCMSSIATYLAHEDAIIRYAHKTNPTVLDISMVSKVSKVRVRHFIRSMKEKS